MSRTSFFASFSVASILGASVLTSLAASEDCTEIQKFIDQANHVVQESGVGRRHHYIVSDLLGEIAQAQAEKGDVTGAVQTTETATYDPGWQRRIKVGLSIASAHIKTGANSAARLTLREARQLASGVEYDEHAERPGLLRQITIQQLEAGDLEEAQKTAQAIPISRERVRALVGIALVQSRSGNPENAKATLRRAFETAKAMSTGNSKLLEISLIEQARSLGELAIAEAQVSQQNTVPTSFEEAVRVATGIRNQQHQREALGALGVWQLRLPSRNGNAALLSRVLSNISHMKEDAAKELALQTIVRDLMQAKDVSSTGPYLLQVRQMVSAMKPSNVNAYTMILIAKAQEAMGNMEAAATTLQYAGRIVEVIKDRYLKANALIQLVWGQLDVGNKDQAVATLRHAAVEVGRLKAAEQGSRYDSLLYLLTLVQAKTGDFQGALRTAQFIVEEGPRAGALVQVASAQGQARDAKGALVWISQLDNHPVKARALLSVALGCLRNA
jgi:tetratricopeptide (TPR) repeat protein